MPCNFPAIPTTATHEIVGRDKSQNPQIYGTKGMFTDPGMVEFLWDQLVGKYTPILPWIHAFLGGNP